MTSRHALATAVAAALLGPLGGAGEARGDEVSAALAKYDKPVSASIDRALAFLARRQSSDGSIQANPTSATAVTSLSVMAFLAAQQVNKSPTHRGGWRYQHTSTDSDISCSGWSVMSLRSARNNGAAVPVEAVNEAIGFIRRCRVGGGAFAYQPGGQAGLARTGTALLCLELCGHHAGKEAVAAGEYVLATIGSSRSGAKAWEARAEEQNRRYAKVVADAKQRAEAAKSSGQPATIVRRLAERHKQVAQRYGELAKRRVLLARQRAVKMRFGGSHFYYGLYYCSQGMFQLGGRYWERFGAFLYETMLKFQQPDGSWPRQSVGSCYSTAMGVLAMSVSYRQLPIYQR